MNLPSGFFGNAEIPTYDEVNKAKKDEEIGKRKAYEAQEQKKQAFKIPESELLAGQADFERKEAERRAEEAQKQQQAARGSQQDYIKSLKEKASGTYDTAAQRALQASAERSAAQQKAVAASQGPTSAAGLRASARSGAQMGQQTQQTADQLRVREQLAARQQLANALGQQRQQDIGLEQFSSQLGQQGLSDQLKLSLQQQQAAGAGEALKVEEALGKEGIQLQSDLANIQAQAAQKRALTGGLGAIGGAVLGNTLLPGVGGALGASLGGSIGQLLLNKGGKVQEPGNKKDSKMPKNLSKEEKFGFKKALESNTGNDNNYARGGSTSNRGLKTGEVIPSGSGLNVEALKKASRSKENPFKDRYEKAANIEDIEKFKTQALQQTQKARKQRQQATAQGRETRASQATLADQFKAQAAGQGPSLANLQLKAKGDASLADQLAAAQSGKRPVAAPQLQQALSKLQTQQAGSIAEQAAQLAAQESQQATTSGLGVAGQMRAGDISQLQSAQQLAQQQLLNEAAVRQAEQQAAQNYLSLTIDEMAAREAANQARKSAKKSSGGGLLSSIFRNSGGKIPGKEVVKGDHIKNDTVPAMLSPGEIVIPKTVVNKGEKAMLGFIKGIQQMSKGGEMKKKYNKGGLVNEDDKEKDKKKKYSKKELRSAQGEYEKKQKADSAAKAQAGVAIAKGAGEILGKLEKQKRDIEANKSKAAQEEFSRALGRVRGRRNYAKGGKVSSNGYGAVLEAKNKYKKGK